MDARVVAALDSENLARRLRELAGEERNVQVDFLLHLEEFDRRRAFLDAGYESLWAYCLGALHLREGPAGRRIGAMRVLRRFPALEPALRDARLCLSTVTLLGPLLTEENLAELVARAAYRTKAEVEHLIAAMQPRVAPIPGIRKLPVADPVPAVPDAVPRQASLSERLSSSRAPAPDVETPGAHVPAPALVQPEPAPAASKRPAETRRPVEVHPVSAEEWSLRVTIDASLKADLETLTSLVSHTAGGDLAAVLHEAIRCGIEKHGKRRGAVRPVRERVHDSAGEARSAKNDRAIPAAVRRAVWQRDGGCCTWRGPDGRRCGSRWKLEFDHILSVALGGESTGDNVRLLCRNHNMLHAEQVFGREHMSKFRARSTLSMRPLFPG